MKQFTIMREYTDGDNYNDISTTESFGDVLYACSVWLEDPDCIHIVINDMEAGKTIMDYHR